MALYECKLSEGETKPIKIEQTGFMLKEGYGNVTISTAAPSRLWVYTNGNMKYKCRSIGGPAYNGVKVQYLNSAGQEISNTTVFNANTEYTMPIGTASLLISLYAKTGTFTLNWSYAVELMGLEIY